MSGQMFIDALAFAQESQVLEASLPVSDLLRLHDWLSVPPARAADLPDLRFRLAGKTDGRNQGGNSQGKAQLVLTVEGVLPLTCQRCLEPVDFTLDLESVLELVVSDDAITQNELEDDSRDYIVAEREMNVAALIEDEVILALPIVPSHAACVLPRTLQDGQDGEKEQSSNPFAALAGIKDKTR